MMPLRLTVLGSGSIVPSPGRRTTSLLVEGAGSLVLLDCGPDAPHALAETGRSFRDLDTILISHLHPDHTLGLARFFSAARNDGGPGISWDVPIRGPAGLADFVLSWNAVYDGLVPSDGLAGVEEISPGDSVELEGLSVFAGPAFHGFKPALTWRVQSRDAGIFYTGDTGFSDEVAESANGVDLLVAECSFPDDSPADGHLSPRSAGRLARRAQAGKLLLVHLYPVFEEDPSVPAGKEFGGDVSVASDGMVIDVGKDGGRY